MGKTILITGSTDGIGLLTAKKLAAGGHHMLLHGRSPDKLTAAKSETGGKTSTYVADLSRFSDVRAFADQVRADHAKIDVLINNAGVYKVPEPIAANGLDVRFMVNTLAPYMLTRALLPTMPQDGRIINLASAAQAAVDLQAFAGQYPIDDMAAYAQSKRAITLWSFALAAELPQGPLVLAVNPGSLLASKMVKEGFGVAGSDLSIGADLLVDTALSDDFATANGRYFDNDSREFAAIDQSQVHSVMTAIDDVLKMLATQTTA